MKPGDRIATLAWNGYRHMELYYGVSGTGAVLHTINPRLFPEQIAYIVNHAEDQYLFFDLTFAPLVETLAPQHEIRQGLRRDDRSRAHAVARRAQPPLLRGLVGAAVRRLRMAGVRRDAPRRRCATRPARRATRRACCTPIARRCCIRTRRAWSTAWRSRPRESVLLVVPMFHVNAWGMPYAGAMSGAKLVLPGPALDGKSVYATDAGRER